MQNHLFNQANEKYFYTCRVISAGIGMNEKQVL